MFRTAVQSVKTLYIFENGVWGVAPSGVRAAAPHSAPARMPGRVCRKALHDAEPTKHTQPFPRGRGLGLGIENKHFFGKTDFFYKLNRRVSHGGFMLMYRIHKIPPIISAII